MYIVYKRTSPSGNSYVGYTKFSLMERWEHTLNDLKHKNTPMANAIRKYGPAKWQHEILLETDNKHLACDMEIKMIEKFGDYNLAKGGTGGDTGRNSDPVKKAKQAKTLSEHWHNLPESEKQIRIKANIETRRKNGTLGNSNPKYGEDHGNWNGYWYIAGKPYMTSKEAANLTNLNESTIIDLCVHKVDKIYKRGSKMVAKGKTPRQCGHYKGMK